VPEFCMFGSSNAGVGEGQGWLAAASDHGDRQDRDWATFSTPVPCPPFAFGHRHKGHRGKKVRGRYPAPRGRRSAGVKSSSSNSDGTDTSGKPVPGHPVPYPPIALAVLIRASKIVLTPHIMAAGVRPPRSEGALPFGLRPLWSIAALP